MLTDSRSRLIDTRNRNRTDTSDRLINRLSDTSIDRRKKYANYMSILLSNLWIGVKSTTSKISLCARSVCYCKTMQCFAAAHG